MDKSSTEQPYSNARIDEAGGGNNASSGVVKWSPVKSLWISVGMR